MRGDVARVLAVVVAWRGGAMLGDCLGALVASAWPPSGDATTGADATRDLRVLVVDNGSDDDTLEVARSFATAHPGLVEVLALGRNHGFAGGANRAVASALADVARRPGILVFVNQDCVVARDAIAGLERALEDPTVAVAGARLLEADGETLQHAGACVAANGLTSHLGRGSRDPRAHLEARDVDYVCGALLAMRTSTWEELGPFDEGYHPAYFEEVDLCVEARRRGMRVVYAPSSVAVHLEAASSGPGSALFLSRYHRSRLRFAVRRLLGRGTALRFVVAEARWVASLRRWSDVAPVLAAWARVPALLVETAAPALRSRLRRVHGTVPWRRA